jgi:membrane-bound lytic murein transglycosylase D
MKQPLYICAIAIGALFSGNAAAQTDPTLKDSSAIIFADDPIALMLDSLSRLMYFDAPVVKANKYNFPADSVPNYSDSVYAMRLMKLDAESPFDLIYNNAVRSYVEMYAVRNAPRFSVCSGCLNIIFQ